MRLFVQRFVICITAEGVEMEQELESASDGALRVARRKALYSLKNIKDIYGRLDLDENARYGFENSVGNLQNTSAYGADELAKSIKKELDRRNAHYKSRQEVMGDGQ